MRLIDADELTRRIEQSYLTKGEKRLFSVKVRHMPTVEYPFYAEAYQTGFEEAKEKIIHSIVKQYSEHNELVPIWLSIGDIKGGVDNG